ncbi:PKD domain-containing protein [Flavobacteriaceae bacterium LMO-SS05]
MNTKRVATQNARNFTAVSLARINWDLLILVSLLVLVIACTKNDDLEIIGDEFPMDNESPIDNSPLIANPGANQTIILPTNFVNLNGSASSDLNNPIISYTWSKILGPDDYNFTNPNAAQTQVTNLVEGVYLFQLSVINTLGVSAMGVVSV